MRLLASAAITTMMSLALSSPAHAAEVELDAAHQQVLARDVTQRCAEGTDQLDPRMAARGPHQDGWFFEVGAGTIISLTVTFAPPHDPAEQAVVTGTVADPASPIDFYPAGPFVPHAYVFAPAGWRLVTATAEIQRGSRLILRHACAGEPAQPPQSPTPTPTAAPTPTPALPPTPTRPPVSNERPGLAATGARTGGLVVLGTGLLAAGVAMMAVRRRRDRPDPFDG
jgi:LPXTG-motif cell wall-anchored protein